MAEISLKKLVTRLLLVVTAMFVFGFALVPIYDVMCKALGINGKTGGQYADQGSRWMSRARYGCSSCPPMPSTWSGISIPRPMTSWSIRGR